MKEIETSKGVVKFNSPNVLEIVGLQNKLARALNSNGENAEGMTVEEYSVELVKLMKNKFDVSAIGSFDDALNDYECVSFMVECSSEVLAKIGELFKKKNSLGKDTMSTPAKSKKKN